MLTFQQLYVAARDGHISVFHHYTNLVERNFALPLSMVASRQLFQIEGMIDTIQLRADNFDKWFHIWGKKHFSSKLAYKRLKGTQPTPRPFSWTPGRHPTGTPKILLLVINT